MTKIGTFYLSYSFAILFFWNRDPLILFGLHLLSQIGVLLFFIARKKMLQRQFCKEFLRFSSVLHMKMKMGYAFRSSYEACLAQSRWEQGLMLQEIFENVVFSPQKTRKTEGRFDNFLEECESLLRKVDQHPSSAIDQLYSFRMELIQREKFRRRSGHIWGQMMSQWAIISLIYLGFFTYSLSMYSFSDHQNVFLTSVALYLMGVFSLFYLRKVPQWKI